MALQLSRLRWVGVGLLWSIEACASFVGGCFDAGSYEGGGRILDKTPDPIHLDALADAGADEADAVEIADSGTRDQSSDVNLTLDSPEERGFGDAPSESDGHIDAAHPADASIAESGSGVPSIEGGKLGD